MATFLTFAAGVFFAIGLSRIWHNERLSLRAKSASTIGVVALLLVLSPLVSRSERGEPSTTIHAEGVANQGGKEASKTAANHQTKPQVDHLDPIASGAHESSSILPSTLQPTHRPDVTDFPTTPSIVAAQKELLTVAKLQSKSDYAVIQQTVRRVVAAKFRPDGGWEQIDAEAVGLSSGIKEAYERWRSAVIAATPPIFSFETVKAMTASSVRFASREAISAKQNLLNTADTLGVTDQFLTTDMLNNIENGKYEWADADVVMQGVQSETQEAYRRWKAAVNSEK
jgi:hypothetical protein